MLERVRRLIETRPPTPLRADLELLAGQALVSQGRVHEASSRLASAASDIRDSDLGRAALLLSGTAFARALEGDVRGALASAAAASRLGADAGGPAAAATQIPLGWALILAGDGARGYPLLVRAVKEVDDLGGSGLPGPQAGLGQPACWMEDYATARRELERSISSARTKGFLSDLPHVLSAKSELEFRVGDWTAARRLAEEAIALAADLGQDLHPAHIALAQLDAATGNADGVREHAGAVLELAERAGSRTVPIYAFAALGLHELGLDEPGTAAEHLDRARVLVQDSGLGEPNVVQWMGDLVESQCRAGREADAVRTLASFERQAVRTGRRWALAVAARCRALLAPSGELDGAFAEAERLVADTPSRFERARTELCWGERLRREHRRVEARHHLDIAHRHFEALGAAPWAEKAARELRSSGVHARRGTPAAGARLTPAETQIAALVSEGKSNKEIAAALFLSPKTIEFHLGRIYPKLNVRTRTQLARAVILGASATGGGV